MANTNDLYVVMKENWHKVITLLMLKHNEASTLIKEEDIRKLKGKHLKVEETNAGIRITIIDA